MGQRGPAPTPVELKVLRGRSAPSRLVGSPKAQNPPEKPDLSPEASQVWDRILEATSVSSHIGPGHAETFRQFCEVTAALNAMQPKGSREWRDLVLVNLRLARELCLTPATSAGLVQSKPAERKLDKYLTKSG